MIKYLNSTNLLSIFQFWLISNYRPIWYWFKCFTLLVSIRLQFPIQVGKGQHLLWMGLTRKYVKLFLIRHCVGCAD